MNFKLIIAGLAVIGALLFLSGCIQPNIPQCGDNICDQTLETNPQLPSYCQLDCGSQDINEIPADANARIASRVFTSSTQSAVSDFAYCGTNCISFQVNQTPLINGEFWVKIISKENENLMIELRQENCSVVSSTVKCVSDQILTLDKSKIYSFTANIPIETVASTAAKETKIQTALFADSTQSIVANGEICANCDQSQLDDGSRKVQSSGTELQGNTEIVCSATNSQNPIIWRFLSFGSGSSAVQFSEPKAECLSAFRGQNPESGKFAVASGTGQANPFGGWVAESSTHETACTDSSMDCGNKIFTVKTKGTGTQAETTPSFGISFSDESGEINYTQSFPPVHGVSPTNVPGDTPLSPRLNSDGTFMNYDYSVIYPAKYLQSQTGSQGKVSYILHFDGVNVIVPGTSISTDTAIFTDVPNATAIEASIPKNQMPTKLLASFDLKLGQQGFSKELITNIQDSQMYQDPAKGLVIKLNNQTGDLDAKWSFCGSDCNTNYLTTDNPLKIDPAKIYKVKVTIGSDAPQGQTPIINLGLHDKSFELITGMWIISKPGSTRSPYLNHPQTYEFYLAPPFGTQKWDGGYVDGGLTFFFRMFHINDAKADPNSSIWLEKMEFYGPESGTIPQPSSTVCNPGKQCSGNYVEFCKDDGSGYDSSKRQYCPSGQTCYNKECAQTLALPHNGGTYNCTLGRTNCSNDGKLQVCNSTGYLAADWQFYKNCISGKVCKQGEYMADCVSPNPPSAPTGISTKISVFNSQIKLTWNLQESVYYELFRSRTADGTFAGIVSVATDIPGPTLSYSDQVPGIGDYYYKLKACNRIECSPFSETVKATMVTDTEPPSAPTNLRYEISFNFEKATYNYTPIQVKIKWDKSTDNVGLYDLPYVIYQSGSPTFSETTGRALESTEYNFNSGSWGNYLYFWVKAYDTALNISPLAGPLKITFPSREKYNKGAYIKNLTGSGAYEGQQMKIKVAKTEFGNNSAQLELYTSAGKLVETKYAAAGTNLRLIFTSLKNNILLTDYHGDSSCSCSGAGCDDYDCPTGWIRVYIEKNA